MLLAPSLIDSVPILALKGGTLVVLGAVLGGVLALYAIYWMIFKMGKD